MSRVVCLLRGHQFNDWSAWYPAGRAAFYRERHCTRCHRHQTQEDR